jgi:hypothetical protein
VQHVREPSPRRAAPGVTGGSDEGRGARLDREPEHRAKRAAVRLFTLPALLTLMEGPYGCWCVTQWDVLQFHMDLPCSATIESINVRGRHAMAVFRLGDRITSKCDHPGSSTAVRFTIVHDKITTWEQWWWKPAGGGAPIRAHRCPPTTGCGA